MEEKKKELFRWAQILILLIFISPRIFEFFNKTFLRSAPSATGWLGENEMKVKKKGNEKDKEHEEEEEAERMRNVGACGFPRNGNGPQFIQAYQRVVFHFSRRYIVGEGR